jgi:group I intron endonuclease
MLTNKAYVGKTIYDIQKRFTQHISNGKKIDNASEISKSLREYGTLNHKIEVLESCDDAVLLVREQYWIDNLNTLQFGYNIKNEHLNKKGKTYWGDEETAIKNIANGQIWNTGISPNKETRERITNTRKERAELGLYDNSYGHKHTEETKKFLSEIAKDREPP